jgi:hypothetical protein
VIRLSVRVLLDLEFEKWARKADLSLEAIRRAANEIEGGLVDARLDGFLIKKRIGRENEGRRSGWRAIVAHREGHRMIFLYGFSKEDDDNINKKERVALSRLGDAYMGVDFAKMMEKQLVIEVGL